jgi:hypothetical protein
LFFTDIPIDPKVLHQEHKFQIRHQGLQHIQIKVEKEREKEEREEEKMIINREGLATPARLVASFDSIAVSADFIEFE